MNPRLPSEPPSDFALEGLCNFDKTVTGFISACAVRPS